MKQIRNILIVLCCFALIMGVSAFAAEDSAAGNGEVYILVTSDVHCGIDQGFGYAGLKQVRDALEWGSRAVPGETGGFQQVSGLSYEIHLDVESSCTEDENGMFTGVAGEYRVQNVMVGDEPLDLERTYTLASHNYMLLENGDGYTMFDGAPLLQDSVKLDNQVLIDYIVDTLGGVIGEEYADPYGQGRIVITE